MSEAPTVASLLRRTLDAQGITQVELANATGLSTKHLNQILQNDIALSLHCAELIGFHLGIPAEVWLTLQAVASVQRALADEPSRGEPITPRLRRQRDEVRADRDRLAARVAELEGERDEQRTIIHRVTAQMEEYGGHGIRMVNVRQVINLLSPTWPDGNYAAAPDRAEGSQQ